MKAILLALVLLASPSTALAQTGEEYYRQVVGYIFTAEGIPEQIENGIRILRCESQFGTLVDNQVGPWQFAPGTWRGTPYGHLSAEDPVWSTAGAAWMIKQGRIGEWGCFIQVPRTGDGGY